MYLQYRFEACVSPIIAEKDLNNILNNLMNAVIKDKKSIVESMIILYNSISNDNQYRKEIECIDYGIRLIEDKKEMLVDLVFKNELSKMNLKFTLND